MKYCTNLDLNNNQILNVVMQKLAAPPSNPVKGLFYFNTVEDKPFYYDGTDWQVFGSGGGLSVAWDNVTGKPTLVVVPQTNGRSGSVTIGPNTIANIVSDPSYVHTDNDYTNADKAKLESVEEGAQENVMETLSVNGAVQPVMNKNVDVTVPVAATVAPKVDGTAAVGSSGKYAKEDHVHPTDTSRAAASDVTALAGRVTTAESDIDAIEGEIPGQASSSNQLADKAFVNSSIENVAAYYISKNAAGDSFGTKAELLAATVVYSGGVARTPTRNDYCVVLKDESKTITETGENPTTRYLYTGEGAYSAANWSYQYIVNNSGLTAAQFAATNSGITAEKVSAYDGHVASQNNPHGVTKTQVGLGNVDNTSDATKKANFAGTIASGDAGFPTGGAVYDELALKQTKGNLVTSVGSSSDDTHYPSAKAVNDFVNGKSVKYATGTIGTSSTSTSVNYEGTLIGVTIKDTVTNEEIIADVVINTTSVYVSISATPTNPLSIRVAYTA